VLVERVTHLVSLIDAAICIVLAEIIFNQWSFLLSVQSAGPVSLALAVKSRRMDRGSSTTIVNELVGFDIGFQIRVSL
jgi:hypothetical protein